MSISGDDNFRDYGAYRYERQQAAKSEQRRLRELTREPREVRLRVGIAENHFQRKVTEARRLLREGSMVRVSILLDQACQAEHGEAVLGRLVEALVAEATVSDGPVEHGRALVTLLRPT